MVALKPSRQPEAVTMNIWLPVAHPIDGKMAVGIGGGPTESHDQTKLEQVYGNSSGLLRVTQVPETILMRGFDLVQTPHVPISMSARG